MDSVNLHLPGQLDDPLWRLQHLYWIENKSRIGTL